MAAQAGDTGMKPTLGLTGVTINAMALIAPGAFLWTTFQSQSAVGGTSMWSAVFIAVLIALLTAIAYAALANRYPEAGTGSSYYYAEVAVLRQEEHRHFKFARLSKFIVGWASHLYYWVYPGVMVTYMGLVLTYVIQTYIPSFGTQTWELVLVCVVFSAIVGAIAYVGVTGSTAANIVINVVQILALLAFSVAAIVYRVQHPEIHYIAPTVFAVFTPKSFNDLLFQSTIAILLVVGFESATALAAESKNPQRDIPRGVILSLIIQGVVFYFIEYFSANFVIGTNYVAKGATDYAAAAGTSTAAPIGDIATYIGDTLFGKGFGTMFAIILAATVVIALVGTALSCLNTGVRVTYAMGKDKELPAVFGFLHGKFRTPHTTVIILTVISAIIGSYGIWSIPDNLIQITLISNIGTFLLYGMTCIVCIVAFAGVAGRNVFSTIIAPLLGAIMNIGMLFGVLYYAIIGASNTQRDTIIAGVVSIAFLVFGFAYLYVQKLVTGTPILHPEDHKKRLGIPAVEAVGD
jgi:basic amino acid/polyamine antiporter, APA family